jgi:hypothetical protein
MDHTTAHVLVPSHHDGQFRTKAGTRSHTDAGQAVDRA